MKATPMSYRTRGASPIDAIGNTPLVGLHRITTEVSSQVFAKLEFMNPMGSSKDRIAKYMIEAAERDGRIHEGELIIENSSGNTAMGLALIAIQKGYRLKVVVRDSISKEKLDQLLALGVEIVKADTSLSPEHPDSYNHLTPRLARETPHCYFPDQHTNRENNAAHYHSTGPEIWEQMEGRIDYSWLALEPAAPSAVWDGTSKSRILASASSPWIQWVRSFTITSTDAKI